MPPQSDPSAVVRILKNLYFNRNSNSIVVKLIAFIVLSFHGWFCGTYLTNENVFAAVMRGESSRRMYSPLEKRDKSLTR